MTPRSLTAPVTKDPDRGRIEIGALRLDRPELPQVEQQLCAFVESGKAHHAVTANLHFASIAQRDQRFAEIVQQADLVVADGMPLLWLARLQGARIPARVTGHDLLHLSAGLSVSRGYSLFLLGGGPGVAEGAAAKLRSKYPGVKVVGTFQGEFTAEGRGATEEAEREAVAAIRAAKPDFLFVGLGCPKQEYWIQRHLEQLGVPVSTGIGCVLDVLAGSVGRAPRWMQRSGLEWLYRTKQEPGRLWKRYLIDDVPVAVRLSGAAISARHRS